MIPLHDLIALNAAFGVFENEAQKVKAEYESNKFETRIIEEENKFYLFTRRVVTEVVVDK